MLNLNVGAANAGLGYVAQNSYGPARKMSYRVHDQKTKDNKKKVKCTFTPELGLEKSFQELHNYCARYNKRRLFIKGFKGNFKIESWINIETELRTLTGLKAIGFIDTQLDKEHLDVLCKWISWINPVKLIIELQQNELDNEDFTDFLYFLFEKNIDIRSLYIIGNPGIYKGVLLMELKKYLHDKYKNQEQYYEILENTNANSVAIIRMVRSKKESKKTARINRAYKKIDQTCYFKLILRNCFTESNWKGIQDLLQTTYKEDNLEQLSLLDISNNYLGTKNAFDNMCELMSSAKGLLVLKIANQPLLVNSTTIQKLIGNRYDCLKLTELDISNNNKILEKTFKLLSDSIFKTCSIINFNGSLIQELATLFKLFVFIEAFAEKTKEKKLLYREKKIFEKYFLKQLDLSTVENYNRHDLVEKLLLNIVFTEFSNIEKLHVQNFDVGRCQAYTKAKRKFVDYIKQKQNEDPFYKTLKHSLKHIVFPKQAYRMEIESLKEFLLEYLFTESGSFIEIESFQFERNTFNQANRAEGFQEACKTVIEKTKENQDLNYSIKCLQIESANYQMDYQTYQCFFLTKSVQLEEFTYIDDSMEFQWDTLYSNTLDYLKQIPDNQFHNLKILKLEKIFSIRIELYQFFQLFIFNEKIQLQELNMQELECQIIGENKQSLLDQIKKVKHINLKTLRFGLLQADHEVLFFEYIIFNQRVKLETLCLYTKEIGNYIDKVQVFYDQNKENNPLQNLKQLELYQIEIKDENQWKKFIQIFIIEQRLSINFLIFDSITFDDKLSKALNSLLLPLEQEFIKQMEEKNKEQEEFKILSDKKKKKEDTVSLPFAMQELRFLNCKLVDDFLSWFSVICEIQKLFIEKCSDLKEGIKKSLQQIQQRNLQDYFSFKIEQFSCGETSLPDIETFQSTVIKIGLNQNRQVVKVLNLDNCGLNDEMMEILLQHLQSIKDEQKIYNRVFLLREINLSNNSKISAKKWSAFWDILLSENKFEQKDDQDQDNQNANQNQNIVQSQLHNTLEIDKDQIVIDIAQKIESSNLKLKEKILYNYEKFTPQYPRQIQSLKINFKMPNLSNDQMQYQYYRLIIGFIIHPESQLKELQLDSLNLIVFVQACKLAYNFSKQYLEYCLKQSKKEHISSIESLKINSITENDAESTEQLIQIFLCSNHIQLKKLSISGCKFPIISFIIKHLNRRENYKLEELYLQDLDETVTEDLALNYVKQILFGGKIQLKKFSGFPKLKNIQFNQLIQLFPQNNDYEEIILKEEYDDEQLKYQVFLITKFLAFGLKELSITMNDATKLITEVINSITDFKQTQIKKLVINSSLTINKQLFSKLTQLFDTLEHLTIKELILNNDQEIYDECDLISFVDKKKLRFEITKIKCTSQESCFKKLIFNPNVGFTDVVLKSTDLLSNGFQIYDLKQKIKYLSLNMGLLYNSGLQLDEQSLSIITKMLVYNEASVLEELILHQCHFKIKGIEALTKVASNFRDKIKQEGREKTCQLSLKRVTLYYSLYIGDDGVVKYCNDLLYFEYINLERFEVLVTNWNNNMTNSLCSAAQNWLQFQRLNDRKYSTIYPIKYIDIGRNEFVDEQQTWQNFLKTFVFTDNTPFLETLNIHFMSLDDLKVRYIVNEALLFLNSKPSNYKFTVKKINFSQNNQITHLGWKNLFKNFFFHPKVHLVELNMISTMLDSQIKLDTIADVIKQRALSSPNKKVPLHTFLCYNVSLKDYIADYLSEQPPDYEKPYDLPLSIEYDDSLNFGYFDGVPEGFGDILQIFQRVLKLRKKIVYNKDWDLTKKKFSHYHLSFCDNYLKILNQHFTSQGNKQIEIVVNLQTLHQFASFFQYITEYPGEPYPYCLIFQEDTYKFLKLFESNIHRIKIPQIEFAELEQINQMKVLEIWKNVKDKKTSIDQIQMEYYLDDDLVDEMFKQGYDEADVVSLIRIIPPSKIRIQNSLSIQAIKGIYSILYDTHYFKYSMISYRFDNFLNIGIGYSLREIFYNIRTKTRLGQITKLFFYYFFNFFVKPTKKYIFNRTVKQLNDFLSTQKYYFFIIVFTNILFFFVTLACPYLFTYKFMDRTTEQMTKNYICLNGISKEASYLYYAFAALTLFVEAKLFNKIQQLVPQHFERIVIKKVDFQKDEQNKNDSLLDANQLDKGNKVVPQEEESKTFQEQTTIKKTEDNNFLKRMQTAVAKSVTAITAQGEEITKTKWGIYLSSSIALVASQLFKFDLFNDVVFIMNAYHCEESIVFFLALATTVFSQALYIIQFFYLIGIRLVQSNKTAKILSSKFINDFYAISFLGRNAAVSTILDSSAPFNVIIIPNTRLGRYIFPNHAGKAMSNLVKAYFFQFLLEDLPQTILQMFFIVSQALKRSEKIQVQVFVSIGVAILTTLLSFHRFLSIRPTNLLQADFDILQNKQAKKYQKTQLDNLQEEQNQIELYIALHSQPKHEAINVDQQSYDESQQLLN